MQKIAVTDYTFNDLDLEREILEPLGCRIEALKAGKGQELIDLVNDAVAVITQYALIDATVVDAMQQCRVIARYGIGVDNVDITAAAAENIPVCNVPDFCVDEVADHTLAMILNLTRRITTNTLKVRSGAWGLGVSRDAMQALKRLTVGVVGFGRIGREVVARLKPFKCPILVFDPVVDASVIQAADANAVSLDELIRGSDLITLHCPSTEVSRHIINAESISRMKDGVMLVNASRGNLVHTEDCVSALRSGKIAAAALDVTDPEPIPPNHPLVSMDNVLISAHIAAVSPQATKILRTTTAQTVARALQGERLPNIVNGVAA